ncbi:hypothetical protein BCU43_006980 [Vibrio lentus]|nr:hypothetical protein [Vibrio lentus]PMI55169.1 hypothetical protein BCU43_16520 [Vibrio lentus]
MLKLIGKIFGKKTDKNVKIADPQVKNTSQDELFLKHLQMVECFKEESFEKVIKHLRHDIDLNQLGKKLAASEKKTLGLNTRLSITSDLVETLSTKGLKMANPKDALKKVYYRATFELKRIEDIQRMTLVGITEVTYSSCNGEHDCSWCKESNGLRFKISDGLNDIIDTNCTCDWNKGRFIAVINALQ